MIRFGQISILAGVDLTHPDTLLILAEFDLTLVDLEPIRFDELRIVLLIQVESVVMQFDLILTQVGINPAHLAELLILAELLELKQVEFEQIHLGERQIVLLVPVELGVSRFGRILIPLKTNPIHPIALLVLVELGVSRFG